MLLDDAIGYRESKPRALSYLFCGEEWIEYALLQTFRNPSSGVADYQLDIWIAGDAFNRDRAQR